jgi:hypothetical protein
MGTLHLSEGHRDGRSPRSLARLRIIANAEHFGVLILVVMLVPCVKLTYRADLSANVRLHGTRNHTLISEQQEPTVVHCLRQRSRH